MTYLDKIHDRLSGISAHKSGTKTQLLGAATLKTTCSVFPESAVATPAPTPRSTSAHDPDTGDNDIFLTPTAGAQVKRLSAGCGDVSLFVSKSEVQVSPTKHPFL